MATRDNRGGMTLVELLTAIALISVLAALLLPAIQAARAAARRTDCQNHLRQIGVALQSYHTSHGAFPIGCTEWRPWGGRTQKQLAWSAYLLPHLGQQALHDQIDFDLPFDAPSNAEAEAAVMPVFLCPAAARGVMAGPAGRGPSHYGGIFGERIVSPNNPPKGVMIVDRAISIRQIDDGPAFTLIVAEDTHYPDGEWINGRNIFDQAYPVNSAPELENDIRSDHPGGALATTCNGAVRFLSEAMASEVLAAICTRAGDESVQGWP